MAGVIDALKQEREITSKVVKKLRSAMRDQVSKTTKTKSGHAAKVSGAGSRFKNSRLQRLTLSAPSYIFMQHYGFEGKKSNGVNQRLRSTDILFKAIESANIMESLANEISEIRLDQVSAIIKISKNG